MQLQLAAKHLGWTQGSELRPADMIVNVWEMVIHIVMHMSGQTKRGD